MNVPVTTGIAQFSAADSARFWAKVQRTSPNGCWLWTASAWRNGYGQFRVALPDGRQKTMGAHQAAWVLSHGPIPDGLHILHRCDVKRCCNAAHLFLGTHTDNMRDAAAKGRLHVERPKAHKVTNEQCDEMVRLVQSGQLRSHVAAQFGVSKTYVTRLMAGSLRQHRPLSLQRKAS